MRSLTNTLERSVVNNAVDILFRDLVKTIRERALPEKISLTGLDTTSLTIASVELGDKLRMHEVFVYSQEVQGAEVIDLKAYYGRALARVWYKHNGFLNLGEYIVAEGVDSEVREGFIRELGRLSRRLVYSEPQFPNSIGKISVDLEEFASCQLAI